MDFSLSEEHVILRDTVRKFTEREVAPRIKELDEHHEFDRSVLDGMAELGLLGICIPEQYGGGGMDYISLAIACEELERCDIFMRVIMSVHVGLCSMTLLQWATEEQKMKYLPRLGSGELIGGYALTEPNAGSDAGAIEATYVDAGDKFILNGEKTWISLADVADVVLIFARKPGVKGHGAITGFIVERSFPGFSSQPILGKLGGNAGNTGSIILQDCEVPKENMLGLEGEGFKIAMSAIDSGRYTVGAGAVGCIQACIDASVKYANERKTFGVEIGKHQLVQGMIADMVAGVEASRLLIYRAGWLKNMGTRNTRETALAKWFACDRSVEAALDAIQIHGAYGYCNEYPVERYLRNAKGAQIYEGSREIQKIIQAQYALGYREDRPLRCELPGWED